MQSTHSQQGRDQPLSFPPIKQSQMSQYSNSQLDGNFSPERQTMIQHRQSVIQTLREQNLPGTQQYNQLQQNIEASKFNRQRSIQNEYSTLASPHYSTAMAGKQSMFAKRSTSVQHHQLSPSQQQLYQHKNFQRLETTVDPAQQRLDLAQSALLHTGVPKNITVPSIQIEQENGQVYVASALGHSPSKSTIRNFRQHVQSVQSSVQSDAMLQSRETRHADEFPPIGSPRSYRSPSHASLIKKHTIMQSPSNFSSQTNQQIVAAYSSHYLNRINHLISQDVNKNLDFPVPAPLTSQVEPEKKQHLSTVAEEFAQDEFKRDQIKKILAKRLQKPILGDNHKKTDERLTFRHFIDKKAAFSPPPSQRQEQNPIQVINQKKSTDETEMTIRKSPVIKPEPIPIKDEEKPVVDKETEVKIINELERRQEARQEHIQKMQDQPKLTKNQIQEKIKNFQLATERRAQERQAALELQELKKAQSPLPVVKAQDSDMMSEINYDVGELSADSNCYQVYDLKQREYRFKLNKPANLLDSQRDTMQSFFSQHKESGSKDVSRQQTLKVMPQVVIPEEENSSQDGETGGGQTNRNESQMSKYAEQTNRNESTMSKYPEQITPVESKPTTQTVSRAITPPPQIKLKSDQEQRLIDDQDQLEICGEQFLAEISKMLQQFDLEPRTSPFDDNGNVSQEERAETELSDEEDDQEDNPFKSQLIEAEMPKKMLLDFQFLLKQRATFFLKAKKTRNTAEQIEVNEKVKYFEECVRGQVLCFPFMNRITDHTMVIQNEVLSFGICKAIRAVMKEVPNLVHHICLGTNSMLGHQTAQVIEGLTAQVGTLKTITIQDNQVNEKCIRMLCQIVARRPTDQLDHLNLYHCKIGWQCTVQLLEKIKRTSSLKTLSLVRANLNEFSMVHLAELVEKNKRLVNLDISQNGLTPKQSLHLLKVLSTNRRLQYINIGWNTLTEQKRADADYTGALQKKYEADAKDVAFHLGAVIKHNKQLQHLDLTATGLTSWVLKEIGTSLRRSGALLSIHLTGNPGLTQDENFNLIDFFDTRIRCRPKENTERFLWIQNQVNALTKEHFQNHRVKGIISKMQKQFQLKEMHLQPPETYVLQRFLGYKESMLGSGQWYEASKTAVHAPRHPKYDCWMCAKHNFSLLLWSRGKAYTLKPFVDENIADQIRKVIDNEVPHLLPPREPDEENPYDPLDPGLGFAKGNVPYEELENRIPYITGSFTGWRYRKMLPLHEYIQLIDKEFMDPIDQGKENGSIRQDIKSPAFFNDYEAAIFKVIGAKMRQDYRLKWQQYIKKYCPQKNPYIINAKDFTNIDDKVANTEEAGIFDMLPLQNKGLIKRAELESDSEDTDKRLLAEELLKQKTKTLQKRISTLNAEDERPSTLPTAPDESKWDTIYVLPFFGKPGRHNYLIKFKNEQEKYQRRLIRKLNRLERHNDPKHAELKQSLRAELFFYNCEILPRSEPIQNFPKVMKNKVNVVEFKKETSVFKLWREEKKDKAKEGIDDDCSMWKLWKFIKIDQQIAECKAVISKHVVKLKEVFIDIACKGSFPAISSLPFQDFVTKSKMTDEKYKLGDADRSFIGTNFQQPENPKFNYIGNTLCRFEFYEILVRIAVSKYFDTKVCDTPAEALEKLIIEHVFEHYKIQPWQEFRNKQLWRIDENNVLEANQDNLRKIYSHYFSGVKKYVTMEDVLNMFTVQMDFGLHEPQLVECYGMSKMVVSLEPIDYKKYQIMQFPEFLELMGRIGDMKFRGTPEAENQLAWKIDAVLEELCPAFGLTKKDVDNVQEENSESDDDY